MSTRKPGDEWTSKDTAHCVWMLVGSAGGLLAFTGHLSIDSIRAYAGTAGTLAVPILMGLGALMVVLGVLLLAVRVTGKAMPAVWRGVWVYRRKWASSLDFLGLTEGTDVPRLRSLVRVGTDDVATVRLIKGQSAIHWQQRAAALAAEFDADAVQIRPTKKAHREIEVVFCHGRPGSPWGEQLALPAPKPPVLDLNWGKAPTKRPTGQAGPEYALSLRGLQIRLVWARRWQRSNNGAWSVAPILQRYGAHAQIRWGESWATL